MKGLISLPDSTLLLDVFKCFQHVSTQKGTLQMFTSFEWFKCKKVTWQSPRTRKKLRKKKAQRGTWNRMHEVRFMHILSL